MKRTKKGFTLIELVIVVAVLVILAAIAIPVVGGVIKDANTATDGANAKTIETTIKMYVAKKSITVDTTTALTAATAKSALQDAGLGDIQTKAATGDSFIINKSTMAVTTGASTGGTVVDTTYPDIFIGA